MITGKFRKPNLKIVHSKVRSKSKHNKTAKTQPRSTNEMTLDDILDKIKKKGMKSLTKQEREQLERWRDKM